MEMTDLDGDAQARTCALQILQEVPVSDPYIVRITQMLTAHGATLTETQDHPETEPPHKEYTITFPPGTVRIFGLRMLRSRYFTIVFPDGFTQSGGELWPLHVGMGDKSTTFLHLPREKSAAKERGESDAAQK